MEDHHVSICLMGKLTIYPEYRLSFLVRIMMKGTVPDSFTGKKWEFSYSPVFVCMFPLYPSLMTFNSRPLWSELCGCFKRGEACGISAPDVGGSIKYRTRARSIFFNEEVPSDKRT